MTDDGTEQSIWPLPKFSFQVTWDDVDMTFQEVSGLDQQTEVIDYRAGNDKVFSTVKMPGIRKTGNVTLKKGVVPASSKIWNVLNDIKMNTITRHTVKVSLLDESGAPTMVWTLANAFPVKVTSSDLRSESNEVAVEEIEIAYEDMHIENG